METITEEPIIEKGGFAIYEQGHQIILANRKLGDTYTFIFVLAILTIILGVNGGLIVSYNMTMGISLILIAALSGYAAYFLYKRLQKQKEAALNEKTIVAIIDVERNLFLNSNGSQLAPMSEVRFSKGFNITSSSPSVIAKWGRGKSKVLFKFSGLVGGSNLFISYFKQKGYWH